MSATTVIKEIIKVKNISQAELAEATNTTRQNLSNKMTRDKFSSLELVEIADALEMNLILKDKAEGTEYIIDYPNELKYKPKRKKSNSRRQLKDIIINEDLIQYLEIVQISDRNKSIVKNYMNGISMNHLAVMNNISSSRVRMIILDYIRHSHLIKSVTNDLKH